MLNISFKVPLLPPSENRMYGWNPRTRSRYLKPEARDFKSQCKMFMPPVEDVKEPVKVSFHVEMHGNWYYKNGKVRKRDGQNMMKAVFDTVMEKVGFDDCYIWEWSGKKVQDKEEYMVVSVKELPEGDNEKI